MGSRVLVVKRIVEEDPGLGNLRAVWYERDLTEPPAPLVAGNQSLKSLVARCCTGIDGLTVSELDDDAVHKLTTDAERLGTGDFAVDSQPVGHREDLFGWDIG